MTAAPDAAAQSDANQPPRIRSVRFDPPTLSASVPVRAVVDVVDPDGDTIQLTYRWFLDGDRLSNTAAEESLVMASKDDLVKVVVTASDGKTKGEPFETSARIRNREPQISELRVEPESAFHAGGEFAAVVGAHDPDGDPVTLSYRWTVNGQTSKQSGSSFSAKGLARGDFVGLTVFASDGEDGSQASLSKNIQLGNAPPVFSSTPGPPDSDGVFRYRVVARDPEGGRIVGFRLSEAPEGMTIDSKRGAVEWLPRDDQSGRFPVAVVAIDREGGEGVQAFALDVGEAQTAAPPAALSKGTP